MILKLLLGLRCKRFSPVLSKQRVFQRRQLFHELQPLQFRQEMGWCMQKQKLKLKLKKTKKEKTTDNKVSHLRESKSERKEGCWNCQVSSSIRSDSTSRVVQVSMFNIIVQSLRLFCIFFPLLSESIPPTLSLSPPTKNYLIQPGLLFFISKKGREPDGLRLITDDVPSFPRGNFFLKKGQKKYLKIK